MIFHSYDELLKSKQSLSLLLFFLLNCASALFAMLNPALNTAHITFPIGIIGGGCLLGLIFTYLNKRNAVLRLNTCSIIVGCLWAWHIILRFGQIGPTDENFLLISLLGIFFISVIALSDNFLAFCLHVAPATATVIFLDNFEHIGKIFFTVALPLIGLSLHHYMLKRSDAFTRRLISNLYSEREKFSDLSMLDPLTGLYNRRGLQNKLETAFSQNQSNHYLMFMDTDHFKAHNDNYGHSLLDQPLVRVSAAIRDAVRSRDVVVRYGGEEFLVLMSNVSQDYAIRMAERIQTKVLSLNIPHHFNAQVSTHVTVSAGLAALHDGDFASALTAADSSLYHAKNGGRNKIIYAWESVTEQEEEKTAQ